MRKTSTEGTDDPRVAEIARLLRDSLDSRRPKFRLSYYGEITVRRGVSRIVNLAGTRRLKSWADTFTRACDALSREGVERSRTREADLRIVNVLRWLRAAEGLEEPPPEPKPEPKKRRKPAKRRPGFCRRTLNTSQLVDFGIEMKDVALVALGCEVRTGEWAYMRVPCHYQRGRYYESLYFVCEPDHGCRRYGQREAEVCIRWSPVRCSGIHREVTILGRVVAVERDGQPVETTLNLRPCDEREQAEAARRGYEARTLNVGISAVVDEWAGFDIVIDDEVSDDDE